MTSNNRNAFNRCSTFAKQVYFAFILLLPNKRTLANIITFINLTSGKAFKDKDLIISFWELERAEILRKSRFSSEQLYEFKDAPEFFDFCIIGNMATQNNWWPSQDVMNGSEWKKWVASEILCEQGDYITVEGYSHYIEVMRSLIGGLKIKDIKFPNSSDYPHLFVYSIAYYFLVRHLSIPSEELIERVNVKVIDEVVPRILELEFLGGRNRADEILDCVCKRLKSSSVAQSDKTVITACAYSVWLSNRKMLDKLSKIPKLSSNVVKFASLCADIFDENFDDATSKYLELEDYLRIAEPNNIITPVALIGVFLTAREIALGRLEDSPLVRERFTNTFSVLQSGIDEDSYRTIEQQEYASAIEVRSHIAKSLHDAILLERLEKPADKKILEFEWKYVSAWMGLKFYLLASVFGANASRMGISKVKFNMLEQALANEKVPNLFKDLSKDAPWEIIIEKLSNALPKKSSTTKKKTQTKSNGTVGWHLHFFARDWRCDKYFECDEIMPIFRSAAAPSDGKCDKTLTIKSLSNVKYADCMTEVDSAILQAIVKHRYIGLDSYGRVFPEELIKLLSKHPLVMATAECQSSDIKNKQIKIECRNCEISTGEDKSGNLTLSMPKEFWEVRVFPKPTFIRTSKYEFAYYPVPRDVKKVVDVFSNEAPSGKITIPNAGIEKTKDILERLAIIMPVAGSFAQAGTDAFERVTASDKIHVRLTYAKDQLEIALVIEPMSESAVPVCVPGEGLAERLVQLKTGKTVLLARNLKAEDTAAQVVRTAMEPFEAWSDGKNKWHIDSAEASLDALRTLKAIDGIQLDWPEGEKVRVTSPSAKGFSITASGTDWFEINGNVTFDDGRVLELMKLLSEVKNREGNYIRLCENDYLHLTNEFIRRIEALASVMTTGGKGGKAKRIVPAALPMLTKEFKRRDDDDDSLPQLPQLLIEKAGAIRAAQERPIEIPKRLCASLRYYQETGFKWLEQLAASGFGACLADDMGLGKTVQIIALLLNRCAEGPSLVVAPASVCVNWIREIERFAPSLHTVYVSSDNELPKKLDASDVVICSYGILVSRDEDFVAREWNGVVLDEAQSVKNADTQRAQIACSLKAKFRVAATGTPVENRLVEFWSIFSFLNPGLLGTQKEFLSRFTEGGFATKSLKRIVEPFVMRRLKRDVLQDLPEKIEVVKHVSQNDDERNAYEALRRTAVEELQNSGEDANRISILAALTRLRRFCCHPSLVLPEMRHSSKLDAVMELLEELRDGGHRALVFSQFVDYLAIVRKAFEERGWNYCYLDGTTPAKARASAVDAFQRGEGDFFLISLKAGGTGLNLTAANDVVLLDPWWNPAVEDQAADRAHRIGQTLPVTVHRIVTEGTVEDRILNLHADKRAVSEDMLSSAKGAALTPDRLMALFG